MVKALIAAIAALALSTAAVLADTRPWEPALAADSDFLRALYAKPASDLYAVLLAREAATFADDKAAASRLAAYLDGFALAALGGMNPRPASRIDDIVAGKAPAPEGRDLPAKLLATTLRPKVVHAADGHALFPAKDPMMFLDYKYVGKSVWTSSNSSSGAPSWVYLRIEAENAGPRPVTQFDFRLRVRLADGTPVMLDCRAKPELGRELAPGASAQHVCSTESHRVEAARLVAAVQAAEKDPSVLQLQPSRINFVEPQVSLNSNAVYWLHGPKANEEVMAALRAAPCAVRNSCIEDLRKKLKYDPIWAMAALGIVPGMLLGVVFWFFPRVQWRAAALASGSSVACYAVALGFVASSGGGRGISAAMLLSIFGLTALGAFNATLWATLGLLHALRGRKAAA